MLLELSFMISSIRSVPEALLQKELRWKLLACVEGVRILGQAVCTLALAFLGVGYWALVRGGLAGAAVWTMLIVGIRPWPFAWPDPQKLREAMTFSWHVVISRITRYPQSTSDSLIRALGPAALSAYGMAFSFAMVPVEKVAAVVSKVMTTEGFAPIACPATMGGMGRAGGRP